jgi:O-6-methylguanine DNA methyltransferase
LEKELIMAQLWYDIFSTEVGWIGALATPKGLRRLTLKPSPQEALESLGPDTARASQEPAALSDIRRRIEEYLRDEGNSLEDIPLDLEDAPPFFKAAWEACRKIPPGETRSYAWLAAEAGRPRAFRAAGQAMAQNRLALIIPCHRVIGSDGGLHGYGGGLDKKARLLELESHNR